MHGKGRDNTYFRAHHGLPPSRLFLHASLLALAASLGGAVREAEGGEPQGAGFRNLLDSDSGSVPENTIGRAPLSKSRNAVVRALAGGGPGDWGVLLSATGVTLVHLPGEGASPFAGCAPWERRPDGEPSGSPVLPIFAPLPEDLCLVLGSVLKAERLQGAT